MTGVSTVFYNLLLDHADHEYGLGIVRKFRWTRFPALVMNVNAFTFAIRLWTQTNKHYEKKSHGTDYPPRHKYLSSVSAAVYQSPDLRLVYYYGLDLLPVCLFGTDTAVERVVNLQYDTYHEGILQMWQPFDKQAQRCALKSCFSFFTSFGSAVSIVFDRSESHSQTEKIVKCLKKTRNCVTKCFLVIFITLKWHFWSIWIILKGSFLGPMKSV